METVITKPEFCPNRHCPFYDRRRAASCRWYKPFGTYFTRCRGAIKRFRCTTCGKTCSTQTFSIHYWTHGSYDFHWLLRMIGSSSGLRQTARYSAHSYRVVQNRVRRLARNALALMDCALSELSLEENLAMDGFESYTRSQYHPNNITTLVGSRSQFCYAAVHTLLRRKGRMSEVQKEMRSLIDGYWRAAKQGIREDCTTLLSDLSVQIVGACAAATEPWKLFTDCHPAYPAALRRVAALKAELDHQRMIHYRVSSRAPRTICNPLFPVNYLDRQLRKDLAEHVRETVKQGREVNCQMERMAVYMVIHNFFTPHRIDDQAYTERSPTHAAYALGASPAVSRQLQRFLTHRHLWGHSRTRQQWMRRIWLHLYENPPLVKVKKKDEEIKVRSVALPPMGLPAHLLA